MDDIFIFRQFISKNKCHTVMETNFKRIKSRDILYHVIGSKINIDIDIRISLARC